MIVGAGRSVQAPPSTRISRSHQGVRERSSTAPSASVTAAAWSTSRRHFHPTAILSVTGRLSTRVKRRPAAPAARRRCTHSVVRQTRPAQARHGRREAADLPPPTQDSCRHLPRTDEPVRQPGSEAGAGLLQRRPHAGHPRRSRTSSTGSWKRLDVIGRAALRPPCSRCDWTHVPYARRRRGRILL